ncbi:carbonic anhydrase [Elizabethkingia anophelis]|uniref:carbonic anhydrase n=1 Tax=Elizabethkingia anophelis TaxID=1117645 RepID=UPI00136A2A37|nr:carbonic anhydrase family protein [Elizabethkingia anophelis]
MKKIFFAVYLLIGVFGYAQQHWSYQGEDAPEHWGKIKGNEKCNEKGNQSPINIVISQVINNNSLPNTEYHYKDADIKNIEDNGHSLQFNFNKDGFIKYHAKTYELIQFHAHEESEHTIDGMRYPLELHFVHKAIDGSILVVGVMVKDGMENSYFEKLSVFKAIAKNNKENTDIIFNPEKMYPVNKAYYMYTGSLTIPPCSENVIWILFKNPITMTVDEIESIAKYLPKNNNRPVQPLSARIVFGKDEL